MDDDKQLLYNTFTHKEWVQDEQEQSFQIPKSFNYSVWSILRNAGTSIRSNVSNVVFPLHAQFLIRKQQSIDWKLSLDSSGNFLAILHDREIRLFTFDSDFTICVHEVLVQQDFNQKWASLEWSPNGDFLFHCSSRVQLSVYDRSLNQIASRFIGCETNEVDHTSGAESNLHIFETVDCAKCLCSLQFRQNNEKIDVFCLTFRGVFYCYVFDTSIGDIQMNWTVNLQQFYSEGVFSMVLSKQHNIFVTGTTFNDSAFARQSESSGLIFWRLLDRQPYLASSDGEDLDKSFRNLDSSWKSWPKMLSRKSTDVKDGVMKLVLSSSDEFLYAMNWFGSVTLWTVPALNPLKKIDSSDMCKVPRPDADLGSFQVPRKLNIPEELADCLSDIQLWSDSESWEESAVIFSKFSGRLDIQNVESTESLTGKYEEFSSPVQLLPIYTLKDGHKAFLGLEMEKKVSKLKRRFNVSELSDADEDSSDEEENEALRKRSSRYIKNTLYFLTESDRLQPPKKKPKLITRMYRLFSFCSTTPEALFKAKLQSEEFGEALVLAKRYKLDCDLVYMRQWRKYPVSNASIHDYLRKITKRHWILRECVERVSDDLDATKALLHYGLQGTEIEILLMLAEKEPDSFLFVDNEYMVTDDDAYLSRQEIEKKTILHRKDIVSGILADFETVEELTLDQVKILKLRRKLVHYLQALILYEEVLGGAEAAVQSFSPKEYLQIRDQSFLKTTVEFARSCDWRAVDTMLTYLKPLEQYRLLIISNFPETLKAHEYSDILPRHNNKDEILTIFSGTSLFDSDWSCSDVMTQLQPEDHVTEFENVDEILQPASLTLKRCVDWYKWRARVIEEITGIVSYASEFLEVGIDLGIPGLEKLLNDLKFLSLLVYESQCDVFLCLESFEKMSEFDRLQLIIQKSTADTICHDIRKFIKPRLDMLSAKDREALFRQILLTMSLKGLTKIVRIYEACKPAVVNPIESNHFALMKNAVDCIYNCARTDQLPQAYAIINCLPLRSSVAYDSKNEEIFAAVDALENHLDAASLLDKYNIQKPFVFYKQVENDHSESSRLLNYLMKATIKMHGQMTSEDWMSFLVQSYIYLQRKLLNKVPGTECFQIFVANLLRSDNAKLSKLACKFLTLSVSDTPKPFSYTNLTNYRLDLDQSCTIISDVAKELIDSSASVHDISIIAGMNLLKLINDPDDAVVQEKDFIEALTMLQQYNFNLLPVQIRDSSDRESLLKVVLRENPGSYRSHKKILRLASLLRLYKTESDRQCNVWSLIAEYSINDHYIDLALQMCLQLIECTYEPAWVFCWNLAQTEELKDVIVKDKLLVFAMCYCPKDILAEIVEFKSLQKVFHDQKSLRIDDNSNPSLFPVLRTLEKTGKALIRETTSTTKSILSFGGDVNEYVCDLNENLSFVACDSFYSQSFTSDVELKSNNTFQDIDKIYLELQQKCHQQPSITHEISLTETFETCALASLRSDFLFSMCCLITSNSEDSVLRIFQKLPCNEVTINYTLLALSILESCKDEELDVFQLFSRCPNEVILTHLDSETSELISEYYIKLKEFVQNSKLTDLQSDIDMGRFSTDERYKWDTVLGLAMTTDKRLLDLSLELASHHGIEEWEILVNHFQFIFVDSGYSVEELQDYVTKHSLIEKLSQDVNNFDKKLQSEIYPLVPDDDLNRLIYFFTIYRILGIAAVFDISPSLHIEVLNMLVQLAPKFPYKQLFEDKTNIYPLISQHCANSTFERVTKGLSKLTISGNGLERSLMVRQYAQLCFLRARTEPEEDVADICKDCIDHMNLSDLVKFSEYVAYQEEKLTIIKLSLISTILRKVLACVRRFKSKKKNTEEAKSHQELLDKVEATFNHIENLKNSDLFSKWLSDDKRDSVKRLGAIKLWLARSDAQKLEEALVDLIAKGIYFTEIAESIDSLKLDFTVAICVNSALEKCARVVVATDNDFDSLFKPFIGILERVKNHLDGWGDLVCEEDVISKLREITSSSKLNLDAKIYVLEKTEQMFKLSDDDIKVLLSVRTRTLLNDIFSDCEITEDDVSSESSRYTLICDLIDSSEKSAQFERLNKLINVWPPFSSYPDSQHPIYSIACKWITTDIENAQVNLPQLVSSWKSCQSLNKTITAINEFCFQQGLKQLATELALITKFPESLQSVVQLFSSNTDLDLSIEPLIPLLVDSGIVPRFVTSPYYVIVCDHVIQNQDSTLLRTLVIQLSKASLELEASDVLTRYNDFHPSYATFSGSITYLKSWLGLNS